eukprot:1155047-Pelagomonas_calceolata.AAC.2
MAEILYLTNHWVVSFHFFAMIFFWYKDSKSPNTTQSDAVVGQEWRLGGQKVGLTPRLTRHMGPNLRKIYPSAIDSLKNRLHFATNNKCPRLGPTYAGSMFKTPGFGGGSCPALRNCSTRGAKKDVSMIYEGNKHVILEVKHGPNVELLACLGRSEARRVIWGPPIFMNFC